MSFAVYDFRADIRNILVTPQIRSRFLRMEPGQTARRHSHDLGHEIFLILQGEAEFEIDGEKQVIRPGQLCVALTDQMHQVRVVGDEPVIMYLSVTPHIQPTHTFWIDDDQKEPPHFMPNSAYDVTPSPSLTTEQYIDEHLNTVDAVAKAAQAFAAAQHERAAHLRQAIADGDDAKAHNTREAMWDTIYPLFRTAYSMGDAWNDLTASLEPK
ncbi:MAG: cupin domain-containing protein [Candidatus Latescibacteria bacterium]|jgi:quercetin dioxygenase-like cupin family protein|nr:cupin domain-containing protein [Candidatus Latescibacterota bacterium]